MGMYDYYRPNPDPVCPACGASHLEWQSKDGPCALFVWVQGQSAPVDQSVDEECKISAESRAEFRLPVRFEIYAQCGCPTFRYCVGFTDNGVWIRTELLNQANAEAYPGESVRQFRKRVATLAKHPGHPR
jgi:hypothetical protein